MAHSCEGTVDITTSSLLNIPTERTVEIIQKARIGCGFFCEFGAVVTDLVHYNQDGIRSMYVDWTYEFFPFKDKPHENGWDLFFEPIQIDVSTINLNEPINKVGNAGVHELHDQFCYAQWLRYDDYLPYRTFINKIINKYIRIKQHVLDKVDTFYEKNLKNNICIGIHVRYASAHATEAPGGHPSLEAYCAEANNLLHLHNNSNVKIFLASDSHAVINYFKQRYSDKLVYIDTYRAQNKEDPGLIYENTAYWISHPAHWHKKKPGYKGGLGTIMDCLLLAKCDYLIHTTSNVSTYVCFFNPYIKSIYLPRGLPFRHCRYRRDSTLRNKFLNPI